MTFESYGYPKPSGNCHVGHLARFWEQTIWGLCHVNCTQNKWHDFCVRYVSIEGLPATWGQAHEKGWSQEEDGPWVGRKIQVVFKGFHLSFKHLGALNNYRVFYRKDEHLYNSGWKRWGWNGGTPSTRQLNFFGVNWVERTGNKHPVLGFNSNFCTPNLHRSDEHVVISGGEYSEAEPLRRKFFIIFYYVFMRCPNILLVHTCLFLLLFMSTPLLFKNTFFFLLKYDGSPDRAFCRISRC